MKCRNSRDHEKLSKASNCNYIQPYQTRKKKMVEKPLYPTCQRRQIEKQQRRAYKRDEDDGEDEDVFAHVFRKVPLH
jgi:hypothetical protein